MDILLIDPPYTSLKGMPTDVGYNIGLTSLAAYLREGGIETGILMGDLLTNLPPVDGWVSSSLEDYAAKQEDYSRITSDRGHVIWKKLTDYVRRTRPAAVGISYLTPLKCSVEMIASLVKGIDPGIKVIVGGPHPTFCPDEVMTNQNVDFLVKGEGEIPLLGLINEIKKGGSSFESVPGIYYRDAAGRVHSNPGVGLIRDLDALPFPARDMVLNCDYGIYRVHCLNTARGCPYTCSFCADKAMWGGKVRRRSVESVIKELIFMRDNYMIDMVDFQDGTFTYDRRYVEEFCEAMIANKLDVKWGCTARYDNIDEDLLELMKRANCSGLFFGLESGSDRVLTNIIDKKTNVEQITRVSEMVYQSGIPSVTSVLLGLPDERKEDIEDTLRMMRSTRTDIFDVNNYVPLPGGRLYEASGEDEKNIDWSKVGFKSFSNHFSKHVSRDDLNAYLREAYQIADTLRRDTVLRHQASIGLSSGRPGASAR